MPIPLLATKLYVPPLRPEWVPRQRLLDRLESGLRRKLIVVSAPAGFGKTTLLSEWHGSPRDRGPSFAWVLLDEQDNDPVRFWSYVLAALERVRPGSGESARTLLQGLSAPGAAAVRDRSRWLQGATT